MTTRRVLIDGQWVDAPAAPVLPPPQTPQGQTPQGQTPQGQTPQGRTTTDPGWFTGPAKFEQNPAVTISSEQGGPEAFNKREAGGGRTAEELEIARRRAFLDGKDSMAGLKAVRNVLSEEVTGRGGDLSGGGSIPSIRFLEQQLAQLPAKGSGMDTAKITEQAFAKETPQLAAPLAPSGNLPQATVNEWLQNGLSQKLRASAQPLNEIAQWQLTPQPIPALRQEAGREAMLAAFAAKGEPAPTTEGEAFLAVGAGNVLGSRSGQFKPGNTVNLGFLDASQLPPLNNSGHYSGFNPGNYGFSKLF